MLLKTSSDICPADGTWGDFPIHKQPFGCGSGAWRVSCRIRSFASLISQNQPCYGCCSLSLSRSGGHWHMPHALPPATAASLCLINHCHQQSTVFKCFYKMMLPGLTSPHFSMNFTAKLLEGFFVYYLTVLLYNLLCSFTPKEPLKCFPRLPMTTMLPIFIIQSGSAYYHCLHVLWACQSFLPDTSFMGLLNFLHTLVTHLCLFGNISFLVVKYKRTNVYVPMSYLSTLTPNGLNVAL